MQQPLLVSTVLACGILAVVACGDDEGPMIPSDGSGGTAGGATGGSQNGSGATDGGGGSGAAASGGTGGMATGGGGGMGGMGGMSSSCLAPVAGNVLINEVNAAGSPVDWVEFYNAADTCVDLSGVRIVDKDDFDDGDVYVFPEGTEIAPKGFIVIEEATDFDFGISKGGEEIFLWDADADLIESIVLPDQDPGPGPEAASSGRASDGADVSTWQLFDTATKGGANG